MFIYNAIAFIFFLPPTGIVHRMNRINFLFVHVCSAWCDRIYIISDSYLVDPASSHMLVSKIKPCMSKYKLLYTVKLRMAH